MAAKPDYNDSIFINCPFDAAYSLLLRATIFAVYRCGFYPRCALEEDNALDNRLSKIERLIAQCRYGIHDVSRTELSPSQLPRFNMPFELGPFFGARRFGNKGQRQKHALVMERTKFSYQQSISDLNGIDTKAHNNDPEQLIRCVRTWLRATSRRISIPGEKIIIREFSQFESRLPAIAARLSLDPADIPFNDLCVIIEEVVSSN
jgi:hypothetical protein